MPDLRTDQPPNFVDLGLSDPLLVEKSWDKKAVQRISDLRRADFPVDTIGSIAISLHQLRETLRVGRLEPEVLKWGSKKEGIDIVPFADGIGHVKFEFDAARLARFRDHESTWKKQQAKSIELVARKHALISWLDLNFGKVEDHQTVAAVVKTPRKAHSMAAAAFERLPGTVDVVRAQIALSQSQNLGGLLVGLNAGVLKTCEIVDAGDKMPRLLAPKSIEISQMTVMIPNTPWEQLFITRLSRA